MLLYAAWNPYGFIFATRRCLSNFVGKLYGALIRMFHFRRRPYRPFLLMHLNGGPTHSIQNTAAMSADGPSMVIPRAPSQKCRT